MAKVRKPRCYADYSLGDLRTLCGIDNTKVHFNLLTEDVLMWCQGGFFMLYTEGVLKTVSCPHVGHEAIDFLRRHTTKCHNLSLLKLEYYFIV